MNYIKLIIFAYFLPIKMVTPHDPTKYRHTHKYTYTLIFLTQHIFLSTLPGTDGFIQLKLVVKKDRILKLN